MWATGRRRARWHGRVFPARSPSSEFLPMRSLILLAVAVATPVAAFADDAEDQAEKFLVSKFGAGVTRDDKVPGRPVVIVSFAQSRTLTDDGMKHLAAFKKLRELILNGCPVTDAGLQPLTALTELRELSLKRDKITDAGLEHLAKINSLQVISLNETGVTDDGLKHLKVLADLRKLGLSRVKLTDEGGKALGAIKSLRSLDLSGTRLSDDGLK